MGWPVRDLQSLCEVFTDGDWIESKNQSMEGIRLIQTGNVGNGVFKDRRDKARFISETTFSELKCCEIYKGDCLVSRLPDPVGRSCILPETEDRMITAVDCTILRFKKDELTPEFFNYYSQSDMYLNKVESLTSGATRKRISRKHLGLVEVPLPPIPEQKHIVAILDQAFADIDRARELTERNLHNARELFESYLQQVFSQRGEGWEDKKLGEAVVVERGSSPRPIKEYQTNDIEGVNWIKIGDAKQGQKYISSTKEKITLKGAEKSRFVDIGDLVLSNSMSFGRPYIMATQGYIHDGWFVLRLPEDIDSEYFYYLLSSSYVKNQFQSLAAGAIVKNISGDLVKKTILCLPALNEQKQIAAKLAQLASKIEMLEGVYIRKAENIDELKKSLLQKAFSGQLTPPNSEGVAAQR